MVNKNCFEATMRACQRAKLNESKRTAKKPTDRKRSMKNESRRVNSRTKNYRRMTEDEDLDDIADDVSDDIMVVTDPDLSADEYNDRIDELQDIIDETPEGEVPMDDTYVGDEVYSCPVCGNNFFSSDDLTQGGTCPICGEECDEFVLVGKVEDTGADDLDADVDVEEDLDVDIDVEGGEPTDLPESKRRYTKYSLDEKTLNPFLNKFIKENYKNARSMNVTKVSLNPRKRLTIECAIKFRNGKVKRSNIVVERFMPKAGKFVMNAKVGREFKTESHRRNADIKISATMRNNTIKVEGFDYDFITMKEGKKLQVYGKYALKENRNRNTRTPNRRSRGRVR